MIYSLKEFLENIIYESLHPELKEIVAKPQWTGSYYDHGKKQNLLAKKIKELTSDIASF